MRCETCRHWDDIYGQWGGRGGQTEGGCALTLAEGDGDDWMKPTRETKAHAFIIFPDNLGEFQRAILVTDKDFGCVMHEPQEISNGMDKEPGA